MTLDFSQFANAVARLDEIVLLYQRDPDNEVVRVVVVVIAVAVVAVAVWVSKSRKSELMVEAPEPSVRAG
jgi:glucose uptake protein GlcU